MTNKDNLSRFFGGCGCNEGLFGNGGFIIIIIIGALFLLGDDILEWLFCEEMALIWIILLILLFMNFDFDGGCC